MVKSILEDKSEDYKDKETGVQYYGALKLVMGILNFGGGSIASSLEDKVLLINYDASGLTPKRFDSHVTDYFTSQGYVEINNGGSGETNQTIDLALSNKRGYIFKRGDEVIKLVTDIYSAVEGNYFGLEKTTRAVIAATNQTDYHYSLAVAEQNDKFNKRYRNEIKEDISNVVGSAALIAVPTAGLMTLGFYAGLNSLGGDLVKLGVMYSFLSTLFVANYLKKYVGISKSSHTTIVQNTRALQSLESKNNQNQLQDNFFFKKILHPFRYTRLRKAEKGIAGKKEEINPANKVLSITNEISNPSHFWDYSYILSNSVDGKIIRIGESISGQFLQEFLIDQLGNKNSSEVQYSVDKCYSDTIWRKSIHYFNIVSSDRQQTIMLEEKRSRNKWSY